MFRRCDYTRSQQGAPVLGYPQHPQQFCKYVHRLVSSSRPQSAALSVCQLLVAVVDLPMAPIHLDVLRLRRLPELSEGIGFQPY